MSKKYWLNSQISPQRFVKNANKLSTFYCININPQCIIFLKLKSKTFIKHRFNNQISSQCFTENANKPSTFYCININTQHFIFLQLKPNT